METGHPVTAESGKKLSVFLNALAGRAEPLLLLDYDGTLAPLRVDRFQALPWACVRELLTRIARQGRTRIAIITGRPAHEIAPLLRIDPPLEVWGLHGAERLFPDGRRELEQVPAATREKLDQLRTLLRRDSLGGHFENKENAVVMHWRGASPHRAKLIEQCTRALFEPLEKTDELKMLEFEAGVELRMGRDKGGAVEAILREADPAAPIAYLGDDITDEAAFRVVNSRGPHALSVLVRPLWRETQADVWLRPPAELRKFLEDWFQAGEDRHGRSGAA
jgi:trehalose-phosphatase